jgi:hypothetical protein
MEQQQQQQQQVVILRWKNIEDPHGANSGPREVDLVRGFERWMEWTTLRRLHYPATTPKNPRLVSYQRYHFRSCDYFCPTMMQVESLAMDELYNSPPHELRPWQLLLEAQRYAGCWCFLSDQNLLWKQIIVRN